MSASWKTSVATIIAVMGMTASALAQDAATPSAAPATEAPSTSAAPAAGAPSSAPAAAAPETTAQTATPSTEAPAVAAATPNPNGCFVAPAKLAASEVDGFLANPSGIYDVYGRTPVGLSNRVRGLAGSDPRTLQPILDLIPSANADRRAAIGAGLGRAAFACAQQDALYAQDIQTKVAELNAPEVVAAFVTASNDVQVAALGAGATGNGGGPAAGLSGGGDAGPFSAGLGGDEVVAQGVETYTFNGNRLVVLDDDDDDNDNNNDVSPADSN